MPVPLPLGDQEADDSTSAYVCTLRTFGRYPRACILTSALSTSSFLVSNTVVGWGSRVLLIRMELLLRLPMGRISEVHVHMLGSTRLVSTR
jgi:hypothetical protein